MTFGECYINTVLQLSERYAADEATALADRLLLHYCGLDRVNRVLKAKENIHVTDKKNIENAVAKLLVNMPLQYILGEAYFLDLILQVTPSVLIPRPETEELVMYVLKWVNDHPRPTLKILDIGTGSGCIAIALKQKLPLAHITAIDISFEALEIAKHNALKHNLEVDFESCDILKEKNWDSLGKFDIIISNPPYVTQSDKQLMHPNVIDYEPSLALYVSDEDPLHYYKAIMRFSQNHMLPNGGLWFEINEAYGNELKQLCMNSHFLDCNIFFDIQGKSRFLHCY